MPRRQSYRARVGLVAGLIPCAVGVGAIAYSEARLRHMERLDPILDAPGGAHVQVDGQLVHYEVSGDGPTIVLIHGFGGSTYSWRKNIGPLADAGYRVLALDLIGFGYSQRTPRPIYTPTAQAELVRRFLESTVAADELTVGQVASELSRPGYVLVGNSMGAAVALRFAADYPDMTKAVVVTAPAIFFRRRFWSRMLPLFGTPVVGRLLARTIFYYVLANRRSSSRMLASAYGSRIGQVTEPMRESMLRPLQVRGSADAALGLALSREARSLVDDLASIQAPVLVVAGGRDRAVPLASVRRTHAHLPHSRMVVLPEAGHLVQEDAAEEFNRLVVDFVRANTPRET